MKIAIIGTAGRHPHAQKLNKEKYLEMVSYVASLEAVKDSILVSGGAAWSDHIAVVLFILNRCQGLSLHLPCQWNWAMGRYFDEGVQDFRKNPGRFANWYHNSFGLTLNGNDTHTLRQLETAMKNGASVSIGNGFFDRNTSIAKESDMLIAFTFGAGATVADGGTRDTFMKFKKLKPYAPAIHYNLNEMRPYEEAK